MSGLRVRFNRQLDADGKPVKQKDLVAQACGAGAQCSEATLNATILAQGANADTASANLQTVGAYGAPAAGLVLIGPEAVTAAVLAGGIDYAGSTYSYLTGLSKDKPNATNSYVAGVIGGATFPFAIADGAIAGMGIAGKIAATTYNAGVAGVGAFGTAGITHQSSPAMSSGFSVGAAEAGGFVKVMFPGAFGNFLNNMIQGAAGPIQNAVTQGVPKQ